MRRAEDGNWPFPVTHRAMGVSVKVSCAQDGRFRPYLMARRELHVRGVPEPSTTGTVEDSHSRRG